MGIKDNNVIVPTATMLFTIEMEINISIKRSSNNMMIPSFHMLLSIYLLFLNKS